ncbi:hypothetical protein DRW03_11840 [Corallococcus sp. H22C18031201]|nr:hypothetical protein DRW03_11840 [Corallococcus sp. H22C18031201]
MSAALHRLFLSAFLFASAPALAQASRTWVSGVGDDANPCSRTAPCKTFAGAYVKTAPGGEIDALDPGGFGPLTITHAITLDGGLHAGGVLATNVPGIIVNAGPTDVVILRRLNLSGGGTGSGGTTGIQFNSGRALYVERSRIHGFAQDGIRFAPVDGGQLYLDQSSVFANGGAGLTLGSTGSSAVAVLSRSDLSRNQRGLALSGGAFATLYDDTVSGNTEAGLWVRTEAGTAAELNVESLRLTGNGVGIHAASLGADSRALVRLSKAVVQSNAQASTRLLGTGAILSFGNNRMEATSTTTCAAGTLSLEPSALATTLRGSPFAPVEFATLGALGIARVAVTGALPRGLTLTGGVLFGTPEEGGDFPLTLSATDGNGCTVSRNSTLTVTCPPMALTPDTLPDATTGQPYPAAALTHSGGVGTSTFSLEGKLPIGLEFRNGALTGMPTQFGEYPLTVSATDEGRCSASHAYTLKVIRSADFQETQAQLTASANPVHEGESLTLTVQVQGGTGEPTGTTTLLMGTQVLSTVALQGRQGRHTVTGLQPGHYTFTSIYSGDTRFGGSVSPTVELEVVKKAPATPDAPSATQDKGCGCNESGASGGVALLLLGVLLGRRRRAA